VHPAKSKIVRHERKGMMKYIKKPIPVEISEPWDIETENVDVLKITFAPWALANKSWYKVGNCKTCYHDVDAHGWVGTLEGGHIVCPGDRIVTGIHGEKYPIKPSIFAESYEPYVEQAQQLPDDHFLNL